MSSSPLVEAIKTSRMNNPDITDAQLISALVKMGYSQYAIQAALSSTSNYGADREQQRYTSSLK